MRPRRAALSSLRGTLCFWPATVTPTSSVRLAFHCARRLRVFARDILRLGTAMIELSFKGPECRRRSRQSDLLARSSVTTIGNRIAGELLGLQNSASALTRDRRQRLTYRLVGAAAKG